MPKVTYRGPADAVELDGIRVEKGTPIELTNEQLVRLRKSDPAAVVEGDAGAESPDDVARIYGAQQKQRERALRASEKNDATATADKRGAGKGA